MPQTYIFGYGSLMNATSRRRTTPNAVHVRPVIVSGIARGWWVYSKTIGPNVTYLAVTAEADARTNGVVYAVTDEELAATDRRERSYVRQPIPAAAVTVLDGDTPLEPDDQVWAYLLPGQRQHPDPDHPIVQSYVDVCLTGCLDIEDHFPQAKAAGYAALFMQQTANWSRYWVNDRIYPRRPHVHVPRAYQIDQLLREHLPDEFAHIQLEPPNWS